MKIKRYYGTSLIGTCRDCGQFFKDYLKPKEAYNHAKKTSHRVVIEKNIVINYN